MLTEVGIVHTAQNSVQWFALQGLLNLQLGSRATSKKFKLISLTSFLSEVVGSPKDNNHGGFSFIRITISSHVPAFVEASSLS